mgnify:CR=1 FL=1
MMSSGSMKASAMSVRACWAPVVTSTWSAFTRMPRSRIMSASTARSPGEPVGGAVLQRYRAGLGAFNGGQRGAANVPLGQKRHSGHAARQRDYIVARSGGEQVAHGRRAHLAHASGDLVAGGVEGDVS